MTKFQYNKNASKLHKCVGECLRASEVFGHQKIHQEYLVNKVNPDYTSGAHRFDWVIPKLEIVIECHGKQHYEPVAFGGDWEVALSAYADQKSRDRTKKEAALSAGYKYIEIPYIAENDITEELILQMLCDSYQELEDYQLMHQDEVALREARENEVVALLQAKKKAYQKEARKKYLASQRHKRQLAEQREFRKSQWRKIKANG